MEGRDQFTEWYKKRFNALNEQPPKAAWDAISNELDINDVWSEVNAALNVAERKKTLVRRLAYISSFLLLLVISGGVIVNSYLSSENKTGILKKNDNSDETNTPAKLNGESIISNKPNKELQNDVTFHRVTSNENLVSNKINIATSNTVTAHISIAAFSNRRTKKSRTTETIALQKVRKHAEESGDNVVIESDAKSSPEKNYLEASAGQNSILIPQTSYISMGMKDSTYLQSPHTNLRTLADLSQKFSFNTAFKGFYAGVNYSLNNVALLNSLTVDGFKSHTLNETVLSFGNDYGVSAGYNFGPKWGAELNWYINSQQGQTYHVYDNAEYITKQIKMDFTAFNISLKRRNPGYDNLFKTSRSQNLLVGITFGILTGGKNTSVSELRSKSEDINSSFTNANYGLKVGYEYEILAFKRILISSALIGNFGLKNIYNGSSSENMNLKNTHTASIGINFGIKYLFK